MWLFEGVSGIEYLKLYVYVCVNMKENVWKETQWGIKSG